MKTQKSNSQGGFTLIETLMAMAIFTIGILGLFGMQTAVIKKNLAANTITTGATRSADGIERLLGRDYDELDDTNNDGCAGLNNRTKDTDDNPAADPVISGTDHPVYRMYWNVAVGCSMNTIPKANSVKEEQKPKHIRVIITVERLIGEKEVAVYDYIKQNSRED
ncbi:type IV pilus modification PilV family protein [Candidatus Electronema sp. JC]|uniref:type IV pilus modification PilV family protein n=1 Tax=Candidatus Electronema sp. JC TaxID=3401570 RepID=UPI003AA917C9